MFDASDPTFKGIIQHSQGEAKVWITLPDFATIQIKSCVKNLSDLLTGINEIFS